MARNDGIIPISERFGLSRAESAAMIGVSPNTFEMMVEDGRMPRPKAIGTRRVWSRAAVAQAFENLPDDSGKKPRQDARGAAPWEKATAQP